MTGGFLEEPTASAQVQALYDEDLADGGYVWNVSRLWAHQPGTLNQLFELMSEAFTKHLARMPRRSRRGGMVYGVSSIVLRSLRESYGGEDGV
jgi:hypothetical protein